MADCVLRYEEKPLGNLLETARDLGLSQFSQHIVRSNLSDLFENQGAFTVFAPSDQAFMEASPYER